MIIYHNRSGYKFHTTLPTPWAQQNNPLANFIFTKLTLARTIDDTRHTTQLVLRCMAFVNSTNYILLTIPNLPSVKKKKQKPFFFFFYRCRALATQRPQTYELGIRRRRRRNNSGLVFRYRLDVWRHPCRSSCLQQGTLRHCQFLLQFNS